jgi:putative flippase GtrA
VVRSVKRELISRAYNRLLRTVLGARFSDAQCGFKALRTSAARRLVPVVRDEGWFFDTELLVAAQRQGMRVHEVPVDWVEDPDSSVDVVATALEDLRGVARLLFEARLSRFLAVGVASTIAYAVLYLLLSGSLGPAGANALALGVTAVANIHANRRLTFGISERQALLRQHLMGALIYLVTLGATTGALAALHQLEAEPSRALETALLAATSLCTTAVRYLALRSWVFAGRRPSRRQAA